MEGRRRERARGESKRGREEGGERGGGLGRVEGGRSRAGHGGPSKGRDSNSDFLPLSSPSLACSNLWRIQESWPPAFSPFRLRSPGPQRSSPSPQESGLSSLQHQDWTISPTLVPISSNSHLLTPPSPGFHSSHVTPSAGGLCPSHPNSHPAFRGHFGQVLVDSPGEGVPESLV